MHFKILKIILTSGFLTALRVYQIRFRSGLCPDPAGDLTALPRRGGDEKKVERRPLLIPAGYANGLIWMMFGRQMKNDMPMTTQTWKSKQEVEFQHGGHIFSETESSNIPVVDWDILPIFGQVDIDLPKWLKSRKNETGSRIAMPWLPSWKMDMTS